MAASSGRPAEVRGPQGRAGRARAPRQWGPARPPPPFGTLWQSEAKNMQIWWEQRPEGSGSPPWKMFPKQVRRGIWFMVDSFFMKYGFITVIHRIKKCFSSDILSDRYDFIYINTYMNPTDKANKWLWNRLMHPRCYCVCIIKKGIDESQTLWSKEKRSRELVVMLILCIPFECYNYFLNIWILK